MGSKLRNAEWKAYMRKQQRHSKFVRLRKFFLDKRAISVAISNVIFASVVVTLGFVVLYWTYGTTSSLNHDYNEVMDSNLARIKEKLVFEYVFYDMDDGKLFVYLLNCGKSNDVAIASVYVRNSTWYVSFSNVELKLLNGTSTESLDVGEQGYFTVSISLVVNSSYVIQLVTERGRAFETSFIA